jgi:hypothetical protein
MSSVWVVSAVQTDVEVAGDVGRRRQHRQPLEQLDEFIEESSGNWLRSRPIDDDDGDSASTDCGVTGDDLKGGWRRTRRQGFQ